MTLAEVRDAVRSRLDRCLDGDGPTILRAALLRCHDPSHQPDHQGRARPDYKSVRTLPSLDLIIHPRRREVYVFLRWNGHIPLPGCAEGAASGPGGRPPVTAEMLRQSVERLRAGAAEFIAPELAHGQLPEMGCLDPNRCESGHPSCVEVAYTAGIEVFPLSELGAGPGLMEAHMEFPRPSWIEALDPDSYAATDERLGYGVSWCHDRKCRNYYRSFKKPFMRLKDLYWERKTCLFGFPMRVYGDSV